MSIYASLLKNDDFLFSMNIKKFTIYTYLYDKNISLITDEELSNIISYFDEDNYEPEFWMFRLVQFINNLLINEEEKKFWDILKCYTSNFEDLQLFVKDNPKIANFLILRINDHLNDEFIAKDENYKAIVESLLYKLEKCVD